ncbi:hypothetical protein RFI_29819, partial [Reticulomyxa filosa]
IQVFNGHEHWVNVAEYSPFVIKNNIGNSNVICSGSMDSTIRFWDIRSNKNELFMIKGYERVDNGIYCLKFIGLKKKKETKNVTYDLNLCYDMKLLLFENIEKCVLSYFVVKKLKNLHSMFFEELKIIINRNCYLRIKTLKKYFSKSPFTFIPYVFGNKIFLMEKKKTINKKALFAYVHPQT